MVFVRTSTSQCELWE